MNHQLTPPVDLRIRIPVLMLLLVPLFFTRVTLIWRILGCFMPMVFAGTFRSTWIRNGVLETRLYIAFIPVRYHRCKLPAVVYVDTKYGGSTPGFWTFFLFGPIQWIFGWIFDFLIPAIGGPYELWVETAKGREFIVWQGYSQHHFEKNLELIRNQSGAQIRAR